MSQKKPRSKLVKVEVVIGTLQIEWPPGKPYSGKSRIFSKGDTFRLPRERAERLGNSAKIIPWNS